jgi:hypothetical protein
MTNKRTKDSELIIAEVEKIDRDIKHPTIL